MWSVTGLHIRSVLARSRWILGTVFLLALVVIYSVLERASLAKDPFDLFVKVAGSSQIVSIFLVGAFLILTSRNIFRRYEALVLMRVDRDSWWWSLVLSVGLAAMVFVLMIIAVCVLASSVIVSPASITSYSMASLVEESSLLFLGLWAIGTLSQLVSILVGSEIVGLITLISIAFLSWVLVALGFREAGLWLPGVQLAVLYHIASKLPVSWSIYYYTALLILASWIGLVRIRTLDWNNS
jgi:hypothetical protein